MPYSPLPYVRGGSIGELIGLQGQHQAEAIRQRGDVSAALWQNIGSQIQSALQGYAQQQREAPINKLNQLRVAEATHEAEGRQALSGIMANRPMKPGEFGPPNESYLDQNGLWDIPKITATLGAAGHGDQASELLKGAESINESILKHQSLEQQMAQQHSVLLGDLADGALKMAEKGTPLMEAIDFVVQPAIATKRIKPEEFAQVRGRLAQMPPEQQAAALNQLRDAAAAASPNKTLAKDTIETDRYGRTIAKNVIPEKPEKPTEASLAYDLTSPDPTVRDRAKTAMDALKGGAKPGTVEDWVSRARRLAVTQNAGKPLSDQQLQQVDTKALQEYKETNADPELRAAALAQKNLAMSIAQMQQNQQPTKEQAMDVATDVVAHRISPEQMSSMFGGFGLQGQAFKRLVYAEAKKIDPEFDFEQASAEYQLVKSPAFQQTVRYMDYVGTSVDSVINAANRLANGKIRSLNAVKNWSKNQLNNVDLGKFQADRLEVADAIAKILQGGGTGSGTSDAKLAQANKLLSESDDPANIAGKLSEIKTLIGNRRRTLTHGTYLENAAPETGAPKVIRYDMNGKVIP